MLRNIPTTFQTSFCISCYSLIRSNVFKLVFKATQVCHDRNKPLGFIVFYPFEHFFVHCCVLDAVTNISLTDEMQQYKKLKLLNFNTACILYIHIPCFFTPCFVYYWFSSRNKCKYSHDLASTYNSAILIKAGLQNLSGKELFPLLLQNDDYLLPEVRTWDYHDS